MNGATEKPEARHACPCAKSGAEQEVCPCQNVKRDQSASAHAASAAAIDAQRDAVASASRMPEPAQ